MRRSRSSAAGLAVVALLAGCGGEAATPREGTSVESLTGDVSGDIDLSTARVGDNISLRGTVSAILSPGAFEIAAEDTGTDRPVLVLNREDDLTVGQTVQVIGRVRIFNDDGEAAEYGLGPTSQYPTHVRQRIVVADEVDTDIPGDDS